MISGELIRLKNLVDDCGRVARIIKREWERLTPEERTHLLEYIQNTVPHLKGILETNPTDRQPSKQE